MANSMTLITSAADSGFTGKLAPFPSNASVSMFQKVLYVGTGMAENGVLVIAPASLIVERIPC